MALRALAAAAGLVVVAACGGDDDAAPEAVTTTSPAAPLTTATTVVVPDLEPVWAMTPEPDRSCLLVTAGTRTVFSANADVPVIPASTIKLLVAAAAPDDPRVPAILRDSDNDAARALVDDLGGTGSVLDALDELPTEGAVVNDATGHDRGNRVTCRLLVAILETFDLRDSLAVAGRSGTLSDRFVDQAGSIAAKTGSIRGVGALAGYAGDLVFAHVLNDVPDPAPIQDALAAALVPT